MLVWQREEVQALLPWQSRKRGSVHQCCGRARGKSVERRLDTPPFFSEPPDVMSPDYWNRLEEQLPRDLREQDAHQFRHIRAYTEFEARKPEIEAAHEALEKYRNTFERLTRNTGKFLKRAEKLFAEAPFEAMRFSAADLQRAFESVGYPPSGTTGELHFENMQGTSF